MLFYSTFIKDVLFAVLFLIFFDCANAQGILTTSGGRQMEVDTFYISDGNLYYTKPNGRCKNISTQKVCSLQFSDEKTIRFIYGDTTTSEPTNAQIVDYMHGVMEGEKIFSNTKGSTGAFLVGTASPFIISQFALPVFAPLLPIAYIGIVGGGKDRLVENAVPPQYSSNIYYKAGFLSAARKKRVNRAIIWAGVGLVVGFAAAMSLE